MSERAEAFDGTVQVTMAHGRGTRVEAHIPIQLETPMTNIRELNKPVDV